MELINIIKRSLQQPKAELGDRTTYVGASDLGCERKGALEKLRPSPKAVETLIRFKRGDIAESIVREALGNIDHKWQLEVAHPDKSHQKAHIDFTFIRNNEIGILECKSVSTMPSEPWDNWLKQLFYQMGLVHLTYPEKRIKGGIIAIDLQSGNIAVFNGYSHSPAFFKTLEASADRIWDAFQKKDITHLDTNHSPLCGYCSFQSDCPAFYVDDSQVVDLSPITNVVGQYIDGKALEKSGKSIANEAKGRILEYLGDNVVGMDGEITLRIRTRSKSGVDAFSLKTAYPEIWKRFNRTTSFSYLDVQ